MKGSPSRSERGMALTEVALLLLALSVVLALVVDIGRAYFERWRMQNAADAAALAGTRALHLEGAARAQEVAADYARRNGAKEVLVTVDPEAKMVRVKAKTDFPTFVAGILGIETLAADNPAAAVHGPVVAITGGGVYPIAIDDDYWPFEEGRVYDIWVGQEPGNFGWLSWDGTMSEGYLADCLAHPSKSAEYVNPETGQRDGLETGKWVWGRPGVANSISVRDALDYLKDNQIPITIVVWDDTKGSGSNAQYHIRGFAQFVITDYRLPSRNRISGRFQNGIATVKVTIDEHADDADFGLHGVKLTE